MIIERLGREGRETKEEVKAGDGLWRCRNTGTISSTLIILLFRSAAHDERTQSIQPSVN